MSSGLVTKSQWVVTMILLSSCTADTRPSAVLPEMGNSRVRVLFPTALAMDSVQARVLMSEVETQPAFQGIPEPRRLTTPVRVSLVVHEREDSDGWAFARERTIVLPFPAVFEWTQRKRIRVIRHELAHLSLAEFLNYAAMPLWFSEGFAEWQAGGVSCEIDVRVRLHVLTLGTRNLPELAALDESRLSYDLATTFFDYLNRRSAGGMMNGSVLRAVRDRGLREGLHSVSGVSLEELERQWRAHIMASFSELPEGDACEPE
jgi:hypothetical protein